MTLQLVTGPLDQKGLAGISSTYGLVDHRYRSIDFCRTLFNENPFGGAVHGFIRDGDVVLGHYAAVPIRVQASGRAVRSAKGEALYVAESIRAMPLPTAAGLMPAGMALMQVVHRRAEEDGAVLLQNITTPDIGVLQRMDGFRRLSLQRDQHHLLFDASPFPSLRRPIGRSLLGRGLILAQRTCAWMQSRLPGEHRTIRLERGPADDSPSLVRAAREAVPGERWTIARDQDTLQWLGRLGRLEVMRQRGRRDVLVALTGGASRELICWSVPEDSPPLASAVLLAVIRSARDEGAALVSVNHALAVARPGLLQTLRRFAFVRHPFPAEIYVRSTDPYFLDPRNLSFDRMMNL